MMTTYTSTIPTGYTFACHLNEIPARGKKPLTIKDQRVLLVACDAGLYAIEDRCPLTGRSIAHGEVLDCAITVPTTGARYCLRTGRYLGGGQSPLQWHWLTVFLVRIVDNLVCVRL